MMEAAIIAAILWLIVVAAVLALLRANGDDTSAEAAADSMRQSLDADSRLDELRSYTRPHIKAITEVRK
jgi:hypothetical protein